MMGDLTPIELNLAERLKDKSFRSSFFRNQAKDIIAMRIKELREKRNKTQLDLAIECNMNKSTISKIEQGDYYGWNLNLLFHIADGLDARLRISLEPIEDVINDYECMEQRYE